MLRLLHTPGFEILLHGSSSIPAITAVAIVDTSARPLMFPRLNFVEFPSSLID